MTEALAFALGFWLGWRVFAKKSDYSGPGLFTSRNNRWW